MCSARGCGVVMIALTVSLASGGCASSGANRGPGQSIPPIVRPTWWSYYQRGRAYASLGRWDLAASDFRTAIGLEPGLAFPRSEEAYRAKTYGLHFLDGYHPHRELGMCLYQLGRLTEAQKELQLSLDMAPTDAAKGLLGKVRDRIEQ